jgi:SAM-dependent methyltransferase
MDVPLEFLERSIIKKTIRRKSLISERYLEVGCGDGFNLEMFSEMGMSGSGIDIAEDAIESAKSRKLKNADIRVMDFLASDSITPPPHIIFMLNILEHIQDDHFFFEKAYQMLPKGGFLVIAVPANSHAYGFADANAGHARRYDTKELREKLEKRGFSIDSWFSVGFPVNRTYTWLFNFLNKNRKRKDGNEQTKLSGIRNKDGYYGGIYDAVAKIAFPVLKVAIQLDRLFLRTNLGNNIVVFARKK